jgi:hypothetical protein
MERKNEDASRIKDTLSLLAKVKHPKKTVDLSQEILPAQGNVQRVLQTLAAPAEPKNIVEITRTKVAQSVQQIELLQNRPNSPITRRTAKLMKELSVSEEEEDFSFSALKEKFENVIETGSKKLIGITPSRKAALKSRKVSRSKPESILSPKKAHAERSSEITPGRSAAVRSRKVSDKKNDISLLEQPLKQELIAPLTPSREAAIRAKRVTRSAKSRIIQDTMEAPSIENSTVASELIQPDPNPETTPVKENVQDTSVEEPQTVMRTPFVRKLRYDAFAESPLRKSVSAEDFADQEGNPFASLEALEPSRKRKREADVEDQSNEEIEEKRMRLPNGAFARVDPRPQPVRNQTLLDRTWSRLAQSLFFGA